MSHGNKEYTLEEVIKRTMLGVTPNSHEAQAMAVEIARLRKEVERLLAIVGVPKGPDA